jgi:glycosyltransferase involved in cell wall biosynthesis
MLLSIVVTTFNRSSVLRALLLQLENQTDKAFQVIVAIDGSTDNTEYMLQSLNTSYDLKWINTLCKGYGLAVARNQGILAAVGRAVIILDDDSIPEPGFVAAHKQSVTARTITGGPRNPKNHDKRMLWKMRELARLPVCAPMSIKRIHKDWPNAYLIENNICLYKNDWIDIGLFSERLKMYGFIGQEFFARAEYLGYKYQYNHDAAIMHHGQLEGDNGLTRTTKTRQIKISSALRPSLMKAKHYRAQGNWAKSFVNGHPDNSILPHYKLSAYLLFPLRYLYQLAANAKRKIRRKLLKPMI